MNDLKDHLDEHNTFRLLYADDLHIYVQTPDHLIDQGIAQLSKSTKIVVSWAESNGLTLNIKKTKAIVLGSCKTIKIFKKLDIPKININMNGDCIPFVEQVTCLGVIIDNTLSWRSQIQQVTKKVNRVLYGLRIIRPCTSQSLRKRLVETLVMPILDYCSVVYSDISKQLVDQLQRLSNTSIRYIFGLKRQEHITPYRRRLNWMQITTRMDYFASLTMYKIIRMKQPPFLAPLFKPYIRDRPTRGPRKDLEIPPATHNWGVQSFQIKYAKFWNKIPPCIRDLPSFNQFKKSIKSYLFSLDNK